MKALNLFFIFFLCFNITIIEAQDEEPFVFNYYVCETDNCITLVPHLGDIDEQRIECFGWESEDDIESPGERNQKVCPTEDTNYSLFIIDADGNIIEEILYKVHVVVGEPPAFTGGNDPNSQNKSRNQYSCEIASDINSFLEGEEYSQIYQDASLGLLGIGELSRLNLSLFFEFADEMSTYLEQPLSEDAAMRFLVFLSENELNIFDTTYEGIKIEEVTDPDPDPNSDEFYFVVPLLPPPYCFSYPFLPIRELQTRNRIFQTSNILRDALEERYPDRLATFDQWWFCSMLGDAHETSSLNSLGLPQLNNRIVPANSNIKPDGYGGGYFREWHSLTSYTTYAQPIIIEVKGRYADDVFDYSGNMDQFNGYVSFLTNNTFNAQETVAHGLVLVLPADVAVDVNIIGECSRKNIPLFVSWIEREPLSSPTTQVDYLVRVTAPRIQNIDGLSYQGTASHNLPRLLVQAHMNIKMACTFNFSEVSNEFRNSAMQFEQSRLISSTPPPNGVEICRDLID